MFMFMELKVGINMETFHFRGHIHCLLTTHPLVKPMQPEYIPDHRDRLKPVKARVRDKASMLGLQNRDQQSFMPSTKEMSSFFSTQGVGLRRSMTRMPHPDTETRMAPSFTQVSSSIISWSWNRK